MNQIVHQMLVVCPTEKYSPCYVRVIENHRIFGTDLDFL